MGKLHELLAVESDLKSRAQRTLGQIRALFGDGQGKLVGQVRVYKPLADDGEPLPEESTKLGTTVHAELELLRKDFAPYIDAAIQKEKTNMSTAADVELDSKVLFKALPATALLNLESKLGELRSVIAAIPTNDLSEAWQFDEQRSAYISRERITYSTKKVSKAQVLYEHTDKHPAQVELITLDERVGTWSTTIQSGMYAPTEKRELLKRVETLLRAVKQARQRANSIDVVDVQIADKLFKFLFQE